MSDYSAVAPPQQNCSQSTAFAAALQRAKQIAAKINPATVNSSDNRQKRSLEEGSESDAKKGPGTLSQGQNLGLPVGNLPLSQNSMGGPGPGMGGAIHNEDIKVPDKMVGLIIGRGGEQISRLQSESGCKIQMAPDSQGAPDRICSLSGTKDAIDRAKELINNIIHQRGLDQGDGRGPPLMGADHNDFSGMNNMNSMGGAPPGMGGGGGRNFVEIMIPGPKVGLIIGKGGETIKQLQEKSGAKMVVIQDGPNQEHEKPLRISGDTQKVEYAKQLVYDLIAEKEMQNFGRGGGARRNDDFSDGFARGNGGPGGANGFEVSVPRAAVGVVIGKGGDMIKKIQAETGARVQFQQAREEGPGERSCFLQGTPKQVEQARQRIEELIESVQRRDNDGPNRRGGRGGRDGFENRAGNRNGNDDFAGGWDDRRNNLSQDAEVTFSVPANKCGIIIGRGGDTIKQINAQSGAHCELDRRSQNQNASEKMFFIRGDPDSIETAKRIIQDKIQMQLTFVNSSGSSSMSNSTIPTAYPGMATQGYNPQGWGGVAGYQQTQQQGASSQWGANQANAEQNVGQAAASGQADYSIQWAEYYRSMGMHREADMIEQQAKNKTAGQPVQTAPVVANQATAAPASANGQHDYSVQWAEYYRSIGKVKEAEAIEAQLKNKTLSGGGGSGGLSAMGQTTASTGQPSAGNYSQQQNYAAYQQAGYYGAQTTQAVQSNVPQSGYGFPSYGYGGPNGGTGQSGQDN